MIFEGTKEIYNHLVEIQAQHWVRKPMRRLGAQREVVAVRKRGGRWIDIPRRNIFWELV